MLELVTILLLAVHLLAMDLASAGPLMSAWLRWRADELSGNLGRQSARWSAGALVVGMISGGLLVVVIPGPGLWNALGRFPARAYWFAAGELLFSLICIVLIGWGWRRFNRWAIAALAVISATNLLYHFPPLMAVIGKLATNPHFAAPGVIDRPSLLALMAHGEITALTFHFVLSSLAVSAIVVLHLIVKNTNETTIQELRAPVRIAARVGFVATLSQIPVGVWLLISLPGASRMALMGKSLGGSLAFMAAMVLSLILLQRLLAVAIGEVERKSLRSIVLLACGVVLLMTSSLRMSRFNSPVPAAEAKAASGANAQG